MFVDLDWPLNASSLLSASAELLVSFREGLVSHCLSGHSLNPPLGLTIQSKRTSDATKVASNLRFRPCWEILEHSPDNPLSLSPAFGLGRTDVTSVLKKWRESGWFGFNGTFSTSRPHRAIKSIKVCWRCLSLIGNCSEMLVKMRDSCEWGCFSLNIFVCRTWRCIPRLMEIYSNCSLEYVLC